MRIRIYNILWEDNNKNLPEEVNMNFDFNNETLMFQEYEKVATKLQEKYDCYVVNFAIERAKKQQQKQSNKRYIAYKAFNPYWTCKGFKYEVGKTYEMPEKPICCQKGFHFCDNLADCFEFYDFNRGNKYAEVEILGDVEGSYNKKCTNKIKILRELTWKEVNQKANSGQNCIGHHNANHCNLGSYNSGVSNFGLYNAGSFNQGNFNAGKFNLGSYNTGSYNIGDSNIGNGNSGRFNIGNHNIGNGNIGDWNCCNKSYGLFNTQQTSEFLMFNKPTVWTYRRWFCSEAKNILDEFKNTEWISDINMTETEKNEHPEYKTTKGYLKKIEEPEKQFWWDILIQEEKNKILDLPNFNPEIFKACTGIEVREV